jgi:ribosomal protein S12 methylthiotransferase accessory factor
MEVIVVDTIHPLLGIPSFYTIIPGAHFRERALGTSVGMFSAKLIAEGPDPEEAVKALLEVDNTLPGKYYVQFYLASCHLTQGDPETALGYFRKALDLNPTEQDTASIYSYMGQCLKDTGKYREAIDVLQTGEMVDEDRTDILNLMGFCYFKLKEHEKAIENFKKIITLDPTSAIDYANIASNYRDLGKIDTAIRYYEMALELEPGIDFARENLAKLKANR